MSIWVLKEEGELKEQLCPNGKRHGMVYLAAFQENDGGAMNDGARG